eukprot:8714539-Alexandrium_andersonii.AAC.1
MPECCATGLAGVALVAGPQHGGVPNLAGAGLAAGPLRRNAPRGAEATGETSELPVGAMEVAEAALVADLLRARAGECRLDDKDRDLRADVRELV